MGEYTQEIKDLYAMGESIEAISSRLWIEKNKVSYICGSFASSPPKKYIIDEEARNKEIDRLKGKSKTYKELIYLSYLSGRLTKELYESAFN